MKIFLLLIIMILVHSFTIAQSPIHYEKTVISNNGLKKHTKEIEKPINNNIITLNTNSKNPEIQIIWSGMEDISTGGQINVSSTTKNTFTGWNLNDDRCSYYPENSYPLWESSYNEEGQFCIDMLEDGSLMAAGKGDSAKVFLPSSNIAVWKHHFSGDIQGIALSPDGSTVYISEELSSSNKVYSYDIGSNTMNWELSYADDYYTNGLVLSGDGNYLLFYQYQNIFILNPDNGSEIDVIDNYGETIPAISNDGEIIVVGDYTGNAQVYEFNTGSNSYTQIWSFHETGGVYSPWITSVSVSSDGNTIALGSLIYEDPNNDIYNGKLHLFNTYSGASIWSFENMGHFVSSIDMSLDGSLIAAATWGPVNNSTPDFYLFEKNSNEALFTINSPGSIRHTDISSDGTICALSGKAIHETTFGNGGTIYCVNTNLAPTAPDNIFIQSSENLATIFWDMPEILDFDHFNIYSSYDNGEFALLGSITDTVYNFTMPLEGYYQFYVTTVDLANQESENSEIVSCVFSLTITHSNFDNTANDLSQNMPNPFHISTTINYSIAIDGKVSLETYDIHGRKINTLVHEHQKSGDYSVVWNAIDEKGTPLKGGIYFYSLKTKNSVLLKKMILMN